MVWWFPQIIKNRIIISSSNSSSGYLPKRIESTVLKRDLHIPYAMYIAALLTIAKIWKQLKCPLTDKWINTMWSIHTMEYNSALKRKDILTRATTWMMDEL